MKGFRKFLNRLLNTWINHSCCNGFGRFVPSVCPDSVKNPSTLTEEFVRFALVWLAMLASAYVVGKRDI